MVSATVELLPDGSLVLPPAFGEQLVHVKTFRVTRRSGSIVLVPQPETAGVEEKYPLAVDVHYLDPIELRALPTRAQEIGQHAALARVNISGDNTLNPWERLAGMFSVGQPVNIEEILDAGGFDESARDL
ncbi:MAG: hypothetical protein HY782_01935 [Chloroflexi bacterium]|nr:hypothetical protein [Chloroflexota bacterium]